MANPSSSKISCRKPASVTNLEIIDRQNSALNSLGLQMIYGDVKLLNQSPIHKTTSDNEEMMSTCLEPSLVGCSKGEVIEAPKYRDTNYQTYRLLNSVIEGQWNDAQEALSLGADLTFLALLKDQLGVQQAMRSLPTASAEVQCNQLISLTSVDNQAKKQTNAIADSIFRSNEATVKGESTSTKGDSMISIVFSNTIDSVVKQWFRWGLGAVNLGLELCQAITTQEAAVGKIKTGRSFQTLSALLSSICLILTIWEIGHEMRKDGVKWRKRGKFYFFYYPGKEAPAFGRFATWFGLILAMVQFGVNCMSFVTKTAVIQFDYLALCFSVCYVIWAAFSSSSLGSLPDGQRTVVGVVKCASGHDRIEGRLEHGSWVFECVQCKIDKVV